MHEGCGQHPTWKIYDEQGKLIKTARGTSTSYQFLPPLITKNDVPVLLGVWLLKHIQPRRYRVECEGCTGGAKSVTVGVYPSIESGATVDFTNPWRYAKITTGVSGPTVDLGSAIRGLGSWQRQIQFYRDTVKEIFDILREWVPNVKELDCKILMGSVSFKNRWAEDKRTHRAYWEAEGAVNLDPILSVSAKIALTQSVPPFIAKYGDAYFYFGIRGEVAASGSFKWSPAGCEGGGTGSGALTLMLGGTGVGEASKDFVGKVSKYVLGEASKYVVGRANKYVVGKKGKYVVGKANKYTVISVDCHGETKVTLETGLKGTSEPQIAVEITAKWDPFAVQVSLEIMEGWISRSWEWKFFEEKRLPLKTIELLPKAGDGGGGGA
jgi:hypothetical protein